MIVAHLLAAMAAIAGVSGMAIEARTNPGQCIVAEAALVTLVGGNTGVTMCESHWPQPDFISRITTWSNGPMITAIQFDYRSGVSAQYGLGFNGAPSQISLAPGELITYCTLHADGSAKSLGKIHLETSTGQKVDLGTSTARPYVADVGTGILIGATVSSGQFVDYAGLLFLGGKVDHIKMQDFEFVTDPTLSVPHLTPDSLRTQHFFNGDTVNQTFSFEGTATRSTETTYKSSTTGSFGMTFSWEMDVNWMVLQGKAGGSIEWSVEHTTETSTSTKLEQGFNWKQAGTLLPGHGVDCQALTQSGTGDFPYTTTIAYYLTTGKTYSYSEPGTLHSVQYTTVDTQCVPNNVVSVTGTQNSVLKRDDSEVSDEEDFYIGDGEAYSE